MLDLMLNTATAAVSLGISVVPPAEDGTKRPGTGEWKQYMQHRAEPHELSRWYGPKTGIGFVCGKISCGLELFEFDDGATYQAFKDAAIGLGGGKLVERIEGGYLESTPGGGVHWFYYTEDIRGSAKLAIRPGKTLIETKGEGGFVIVAPTFGAVHPSGKPYRLIRGSIGTIARISNPEREWLWDLARSFDETPPDEPSTPTPSKNGTHAAIEWTDTTSPGDDFNARERWNGILVGWKLAYSHGDTQYWRRPGKADGHSATVNHGGTDHLHVFSSSTEFEPGQSYSKFGAYVRLHHKGDFSAAAKHLYETGYGTHKRWVQTQNGWEARVFANPCPKGERMAKPGEPPPTATAEPTASVVIDVKAASSDDLSTFSDADLGLVFAERIDPEPIVWEWENRVARGKLNLLAGEGGDGKSQISIAVVAAVSSGGVFPDGSHAVTAGMCVILAAEDGARDTIAPRLIAARADRKNVIVNTAKISIRSKDGKALIHPISFQDLDYWRVVLTRHKVRLLVADPIPAYMGRGVNDNRNNEVRAVLEPFVDLLDELGVAFMAVTHLNKSSDHKSPTHKILGSVAYANLARTVHCTYRDPDDEKRRILCMVKANIVEPQQALGFRIEPHEFTHNGLTIKTSFVKFEADGFEFNATAHLAGESQAKPGRPPTTSLKDAEWLYDFLWDRQWTPLAEIIQFAGESGMCGPLKDDGKYTSTTRVYRAKDRVGELPGAKAGSTIDEERRPFKGYGKVCLHWRMTCLTEPVPGYPDHANAEGDEPF